MADSCLACLWMLAVTLGYTPIPVDPTLLLVTCLVMVTLVAGSLLK